MEVRANSSEGVAPICRRTRTLESNWLPSSLSSLLCDIRRAGASNTPGADQLEKRESNQLRSPTGTMILHHNRRAGMGWAREGGGPARKVIS